MSIDWELVRSSAITVSAVLAALTFTVSTISNNRRKRRDEVREWQRVVIAEIFQINSATSISFSQLLEKFHSAATGYADHRLIASDLSKTTLRRIIVELVESRVIEQLHEDTYRLESFDKNARDQVFLSQMNSQIEAIISRVPKFLGTPVESGGGSQFMNTMKELVASQSSEREKLRSEILNFIAEHPEKYSALEVGAKMSRSVGSSADICAAVAHSFVAESLVEVSASGKLSVKNQMILKGN